MTIAFDHLPISLNGAAEKAEEWLLNSGIFIRNEADPNHGAVYSYYDRKARRHDLIYAEATGYAISLLKFLFSVRRDAKLVDLARASGDWLVRMAAKYDGAVVMGFRGGNEIREVYPFDNGVCCNGLIDLFELTGEPRFLECAETISGWIIDEALNGDGSIRPMLDLNLRRFVEDRKLWYRVSGSYHAKISIPLWRLHALTGTNRYRDAAVKICRWAMNQQRSDGRFPVNMHSPWVNSHTHCYTIEALLYAFAHQHSSEFLEAAVAAVDWLRTVQDKDGGFWIWYGKRLTNLRASFAAAQAIRIYVLMHMLTHDGHFLTAAEKASQFMLGWQCARHREVDGGFLDGALRRYGVSMKRGNHVFSWGTMFAIQALHLLESSRNATFETCVRHLF